MFPKTITIDFKKTREERQEHNNTLVINSMQVMNIKDFHKCINIKALDRVLANTGISENDLLKAANENRILAQVLSMQISKESSRQCGLDETLQLNTCNLIAEQCGVNIRQLNKTELYATTNGKLLSKKELDKTGLSMVKGLKSFDAIVSGKMNGYISAKVTLSSGGHQDNVFHEMRALINWWIKTKQESVLIILIDTDLKNKINDIKLSFKDHDKYIKVMDHVQLQTYMINEYYADSESDGEDSLSDGEDSVSDGEDSVSDGEDSVSECSESVVGNDST
jgi:hypothetical protein